MKEQSSQKKYKVIHKENRKPKNNETYSVHAVTQWTKDVDTA